MQKFTLSVGKYGVHKCVELNYTELLISLRRNIVDAFIWTSQIVNEFFRANK